MEYIQTYKYIAVQEMHHTGIPASIKMAQAILESQAGTSDLALNANNHFGIKCGGTWDGPTYFKKDDDKDKKGRLIPSCFRVFESAESSFKEHSLFLQDPKKIFRYGFLFELDKTDYKSWAWGLKKAGYATNPAYANLLINIIETYSLYTFDYYEESQVKYVRPEDLVAQAKDIREESHVKPGKVPEYSTPQKTVKAEQKSSSRSAVEKHITINRRDALVVRKGQTIEQLAHKYNKSAGDILKYNDLEVSEDDYLAEGVVVFIEKKKRWFRGDKQYHIVQQGETLRSISQKYGIRLSTLERKNKIKGDDIPVPGEKIILRGSKVRGDEVPLTYDDIEIVESKDVSAPVLMELWDEPEDTMVVENQTMPLPENKMTQTDQENRLFDLSRPDVAGIDNTSSPAVETPSDHQPASSIEHTVAKGETLSYLSRKYKISIESIMQENQLSTDQLQIGQILKITR